MESIQFFLYFVFVVFITDIGFYVINELLYVFNWRK